MIIGIETYMVLMVPYASQSLECKSVASSRKQKFRSDRSKGKVMPIVFCDCKGIALYELVLKGWVAK